MPMKSLKLAALGSASLLFAAGAAEAKTSVEWWYANGGRVEEVIQELVADFNASQDEYEVKAIRKGNYEETFAAMIAAYRVGQQPVIVQATERSVLTMLYSGAAVPVYELMADNGYDIDWDDFIKPVADFYVVDDKVNALPFNSSTGIMWYNADMFRDAGFPEGPAQTWQEFERQLYVLRDKGVTECGMALNTDYPWSLIEGYAAINDYPFGTKENGFGGLDTEYVYNTTPVVGQVERLKKWVDDGIIQLSGQGVNPGQLYASGTCATWSASTASHAFVEANATGFDWSAAMQPHEEGRDPKNSNIGGAALWVLKGQSDAEYAGAAAFLNFLAAPETQAMWSEQTGYVPVTNAAYELMTEKGFFEEHPTREIALKQLNRAEPTPNSRGFRFGNSNQWWAILLEDLQAAFTDKMSVQAALDDSVARGDKILRQFEQLNAGK